MTRPFPELPPIPHELYQALKGDIALRGLICPLIFSRDGRCLDGRVRLKIAEELGIKTIPRITVGRLSRDEAEDYRLVINGLRRHLSRSQMSEVVDWSLWRDFGASDREIGRRTGADHKTVGSARQRLESRGEIPHVVRRKDSLGRKQSATKPPLAKPMVFTSSTSSAREAASALVSLGDKAPAGYNSNRKLRKLAMQKVREQELKGASLPVPEDFDIYCCDFRSLPYVPGTVSLVAGDPLWHKSTDLRIPYAQLIARMLRVGGYACVYTGHSNLLDFGDVFRAVGLEYRWLITGVNEDLQGSIRSNGSVYNASRVIAVFQKGGTFKTPSVFKDTIMSRVREKTWDDWQQPESEAVELVRCFSRPGDLVADPTFGTGTVAAAVARVGGRRFLGCDLREDLVALACRRVDAALRGEYLASVVPGASYGRRG